MLIKAGIYQFRIPDISHVLRIPLVYRLRNLPLYLAFYIVPAIAAFCRIFQFSQPEYEFLWAAIFMLLLLTHNTVLSQRTTKIVHVVLLLVFLKYVLPLCWERNVSYKALAIDFKWIYYLMWALLWTNFAGAIDLRALFRCGRNMAFAYCVFVVVETLLRGRYSRECAYLFDECNYVCYLLLIPYCLIDRMGGKPRDYIIFLLAVFLSDSRTGMATAAVITIYPHYIRSRNKLKYWFFALVAGLIYVKVFFVDRGASRLGEVDRVMFLRQYLNCLRDFNIFEVLFGIFPGKSISITFPVDGFSWHIAVFEAIHGIKGCYPFYFHSTYLRLLFVWGVPLVVYGLRRVLLLFKEAKDMALRKYLVVFLMESVSLSTLSLTNVSIIFFLTGMAMLGEFNSRRKCIQGNQELH